MKNQLFNCHIDWKPRLMKYCPHVCTLEFHTLRDKGKILKAPKMQQRDIHKENMCTDNHLFAQQHWIQKKMTVIKF